MRTRKIWRITLAMLAAFSLASCGSDDEDFDANNLVGTWQKVYDKGVVSEGNVEYTFLPMAIATSMFMMCLLVIRLYIGGICLRIIASSLSTNLCTAAR